MGKTFFFGSSSTHGQMYSVVTIQIREINTENLIIKIESTTERRAITSYSFCECGLAFPEALIVSDNSFKILVLAYNISTFCIERVVTNNYPGIQPILNRLLGLSLSEAPEVLHSFTRATELYNNRNDIKVNFSTRCPYRASNQ